MILALPFNRGASAGSAERRTLSLRGLLLLLVLAVSLPLIALAGIAVWQAHQQARARAEAEVLGQARTMAAVVDREFQRLETGLHALADSAALAERDLAGVEAEMRALSAQLGGTPIGLVSAAGRQLLSTTWAAGERRPAATAPPVTAASLASGRVVISDLTRSHNTGRQVVAVVMPVPPPAPDGTPQGQPAFAFAAALPDGRLAAALAERAEPGTEAPVAAVLDRAGVIVARTRAEAEMRGKPALPGLAARLEREPDGVLHDAFTHEGEPSAFAFAAAPRSGFAVVLSLPEAEFSAPLRAALWRVGLAAAGLLGAGAGLAALLAGRIARALQRLAAAAPPERPILREVDDLVQAMAERDRAMAKLAESEQRFRALAEAGALVVWRSDANGAILEGEGWNALTGQSDEALRGDGWLAMLHPADRPATIAAWAAARQAGRPVDVEYRVLARAGDWHWVRARAVPIGEGPAEWVGMVEDVHERRLAAQALLERQERLRLAVEAARLSTWEYDPVADRGTRIGRSNEAVEAPTAQTFTLAEWAALMHPEDAPRTLALLQATLAGQVPEFEAEFRVRRRLPAEGWAWIMSYGAVVRRDPMTGAVLQLAGVAQDISDRREAEQRRILLAREVDHRARNVLAVVQAVLRLTRRDQPEAFIATVESRVAALARAHTLLAEEGWVGADLHMLAERELADCPPGSVVLDGPPLAIAAAAVQPLAMVLHELATNAMRHGAASRPEGRVMLSWMVEGGQPGEQTVQLSWIERGGPMVEEPPVRRGFGSRMTETIVRGQLGGSLVLHWNPAGLECRIALPAARLLSAEPVGPLRRSARSQRPAVGAEG